MKKYLTLILLIATLQLSAQVSIKGVIKSADDGSLLPGASILVKGTTIGVVSDLDGRYSITLPENATDLVCSSIGFVSQTIPIKGRSVIDVTLAVDKQLLDEVVVMGYSTKSRNEVTSAVAVVSSDRLMDVTSPNIGDMLQGKVSGVSVIKGNGAPGAEPTIRIRGISSMNAPQEPLYVVDGIIGGSYDPNDVESITVLKDAGATGMYGAQANGGVIVVTTKRAKSNKVSINFKASVGVTTADFSRQHLMNSSELYNYYREYFRDPTTHLVDDIAFNNAIPKSVLDTDTDWRDLVFDPGVVQDYHVSISGRNDKHSYYNSISFYDEKGVLKNTDYKHVNIRSNNTHYITKWLTATSNINITGRMNNSMDENLMYYLNEALPWDSPYDENGNVRTFADAEGLWMRDKVNPLLAFENDNLENSSKSFGIDYDLVLDFKITDWLSFVTQNRVSASTYKTHYHRTSAVEYMSSGDLLEETQSLDYGGITTNMFKADKTFGKHSMSGLLGYEAQMDKSESLLASGKGLPYGLYVLDVASSSPNVGGTTLKTGMQSFISQVNYNYAMKYFLTGSFRVDQSSTFNKDNRTACFPSLSASWIISNEPFMKNYPAITNLKLKASWGVTGMKDIGASKYLDSFAYSTQYDSNVSAVPTQMANPDLKWEQTTQNNIGMEIGLFDRVNLDLNYYYNDTDNLLVYRDLPPSGGFSSQWQNLGSDLNTGFEAAVDVTPIKSRDFNWNVNFSISYNKNRLHGFGDTKIYKSTYEGITQVYENDEQLYTWYLKEYSGVDPETGKLQFVDKDGNLTYDYASARYVKAGSSLAPWQGGVSTRFTYKNWALNATGSFLWGNKLYGRQRASSLSTFVDNSLKPSSDDKIWKKPGDDATIGSPAYAMAQIFHTGDLVDGDYFKLRNVSLQYTFPKKWMGKCGMTLGLSCDNLFTLTKVWGADPEASIGSDNSIPGRLEDLDTRYPNKRQYVFQVNFTF
ncbi:MAG: SusC/RagA family TonB-linked outer membrane protein [Bacteroidales bacterium]